MNPNTANNNITTIKPSDNKSEFAEAHRIVMAMRAISVSNKDIPTQGSVRDRYQKRNGITTDASGLTINHEEINERLKELAQSALSLYARSEDGHIQLRDAIERNGGCLKYGKDNKPECIYLDNVKIKLAKKE